MGMTDMKGVMIELIARPRTGGRRERIIRHTDDRSTVHDAEAVLFTDALKYLVGDLKETR